MAASKRKAKATPREAPAKKIAKSRVNRQDDPVFATTNPKSMLKDGDLHGVYADPATYENWTKEDWDEVRDCFPDDVPLNEDGYSISLRYLKYDEDWRRFVREFQEDLGAGRYEIGWLEQAALAMEERAEGEFDNYKETEYEEFWGQKQKLNSSALAGESTKVKLGELLKERILREGDELSYRRQFKREWGSWMVEKEMKILKVEGQSMTLSVPPGQRRFTTATAKAEPKPNDSSKHNSHGLDSSSQDTKTTTTEHGGRIAISAPLSPASSVLSDAPPSPPEDDVDYGPSKKASTDEPLILRITSLNKLEDQIIDIDGRLSSEDVTASSAWRVIRAKRANQDLGSLFEMREEYYVWNSSKIAKTDKKGKQKK